MGVRFDMFRLGFVRDPKQIVPTQFQLYSLICLVSLKFLLSLFASLARDKNDNSLNPQKVFAYFLVFVLLISQVCQLPTYRPPQLRLRSVYSLMLRHRRVKKKNSVLTFKASFEMWRSVFVTSQNYKLNISTIYTLR